MNGESIMTVSAAVVALTQLAKWAGVPNRYGPAVVLGFSALGVLIWVYTRGAVGRELLFSYFAGWIAVATSAAGVYGFTRATASSVIRVAPRRARHSAAERAENHLGAGRGATL